MDSIKIILPIYYERKRKTKKNKVFLVGLNWYRNAHFRELNEVKKHYHGLIESYLYDCGVSFDGEYGAVYTVFYKNPSCDAMNVISVIDKFTHDSLQSLNITKEDNVKHYVKTFCDRPIQDKENPRIEIIIKKVK